MQRARRHFCTLLAGLAFGGILGSAHAADTPQVALKTSMGEIVLELYPEKAPKTVANFLQYVKSNHYNGTVFHRVIEDFMIQGGGFDGNLQQKPTGTPIENEARNGLKNVTYSIAMARTGAPHSATAQFFINTNNNWPLDYPAQDGWGYAVFGKVIKGTEIVDKIKVAPTSNQGMHQHVPIKPIVIESASLIR